MSMFTLHRSHTLRTNKGHSIRFEKGQPAWVPPMCEEDAVAIGAVPVDGTVDVIPAEKAPEVELTPAQRKAKLFEAYGIMEHRDERADFTGNGMPHCKKLYLIVGFEVQTNERDDTWREYRAAKQAEENE